MAVDELTQKVANAVAEALDGSFDDDAHVIAELATGTVFFSDGSGNRWRCTLTNEGAD